MKYGNTSTKSIEFLKPLLTLHYFVYNYFILFYFWNLNYTVKLVNDV